ncbi:cell division protein ZapE [Tamaricihabitans halophyticus]|uniref:Cell division protein ZapE n=1 Tax=Tamaricihabitans halophyticus TaxID=1262583 RepID=A0A4R2R7A8_9PSEU|nr:cell division protein ZapE [Tamaricihabitans halophyticus]TCP55285.1 cell division protein ZapE [Tamaricihabitans halophyticus]
MCAMRLSERQPEIRPDELVESLVPPPRFDDVRLATYLPNEDEPSQRAAVTACAEFITEVNSDSKAKPRWRRLFGGAGNGETGVSGRYFDGGFGVGKTHLLASIWHAVEGPKAYATFVELTHLVGALGFNTAVERLRAHRLLAIDEFELDDPGDTMLVTRLLSELMNAGVRIAATSNTLPDKLGEGRFAAEDFLREIHALSARFAVVRVDGPDYRHRGLAPAPEPLDDAALRESAASKADSTLDDFDELCTALQSLHPSRYGRLLDGVSVVHLSQVRPASDQNVALRLVSFADRLYDRAIPVLVSGQPVSELFGAEMLSGGYRKKYLRAVSRLAALARDGAVIS